MKALASSILVLAAGMQPLALASEYRAQPSICVILQDKDAPPSTDLSVLSLAPRDGECEGFCFMTSATYGCACGSASGSKGPNGYSFEDDSTESTCNVDYSVTVKRTGHFILDVDCEVQKHDFPAKRIKRELIVLDRAPGQANWLKLDDRFATYAYLTPTVIR